MSLTKTAAIIGAVAGAFSAGFTKTRAPQAGTKRALLREKRDRAARAALYADTPKHGPSRQAMRHAGRMAAKAEASRLKIIARRELAKAKRERAKAKAPLAKAA